VVIGGIEDEDVIGRGGGGIGIDLAGFVAAINGRGVLNLGSGIVGAGIDGEVIISAEDIDDDLGNLRDAKGLGIGSASIEGDLIGILGVLRDARDLEASRIGDGGRIKGDVLCAVFRIGIAAGGAGIGLDDACGRGALGIGDL
jgi:hypothetical protein